MRITPIGHRLMHWNSMFWIFICRTWTCLGRCWMSTSRRRIICVMRHAGQRLAMTELPRRWQGFSWNGCSNPATVDTFHRRTIRNSAAGRSHGMKFSGQAGFGEVTRSVSEAVVTAKDTGRNQSENRAKFCQVRVFGKARPPIRSGLDSRLRGNDEKYRRRTEGEAS